MDTSILDRDHFRYRAYMYDLLKYCMGKLGHAWSLSYFEELGSYRRNRRFSSVVGDAVLKYRRRNLLAIIEDINNLEIYGVMRDILLDIAELTFRNQNFIKEFFVFSAQVVTVAVFFLEQGHGVEVENIVFQLRGVHEVFLKQKFVVEGGWHALQMYAVRYYLYG